MRVDHGSKWRRGEALDDHLPDAMLAAAAFTRELYN